MERRVLAAKNIRADLVDGPAEEGKEPKKMSRISGYAAVFFREDNPETEYQLWQDYWERIAPGAFRVEQEEDVVALFNHDPDYPLGRKSRGTLRLSTDSVGLRYEIDLPDTTYAEDLKESIARGDVQGSSFSFEILSREITNAKDGRTIVTLTDVRLIDVGPVTLPAYTGTSAQLARSCGAQSDLVEQLVIAHREWREREISLREKELSHDNAAI